MKVLIIRFSSIGDIVLTTPIIRCLKKQRPDTEIHYLTRKAYAGILEHNPYITKLHFIDENSRLYQGDQLGATLEALKTEKFACVIDLHHNLRSLKVKKALQVQSYSFPKLNVEKWVLTNIKINLLPDTSIVERYFETVKKLRVTNDGQGLDFFLTPGKKLTDRDIPMSHWGGYAGCVIGGSYATKKLPLAKWKQYCTSVPYPVMLLGGPEDREMGEEIAALDRVKIYNSCGKFSISESAELVKMAKVVVTNDTGLMHIAAAYQKPIVSVWGNTTPEMGMFPYYGENNLGKKQSAKLAIVENNNTGCRPCSKLGYNACPMGHFDCMNGIDMNVVAQQTEVLWPTQHTTSRTAGGQTI